MTAPLTFDDEFNSLSLWNGTSGTWSTTTAFVDPNGNGSSLPGNGEQEWYINSNYAPTASVKPWTVNNGVLTITANKIDPSIAQYLGYNQTGLPAMGSYQYTSGLLETNHSFSQTYGYFEMRAELPAGQGMWPAFWLMPSDGSWPPELDIMEVLGRDPSTLYTTVHTMQTGTHTSSGIGSLVANTSTGYHTYAVDWEPKTITWYFDNKPVYQVATPSDLNKPMYMIVNLALGGGWAGNVDSTTQFPAQMNVDYVRAYSSNPYTYTPEGSTGAGQSFSATGGVTLTGTSGDDTFTIGQHGNDTVTGGTGHDTYVFTAMPWQSETITDFQVGSDKLDLHALIPNYTGSDPIADGYVVVTPDSRGGYDVEVNPDGHATAANPYPTFVAYLPGVTDVGLTSANLLVDTSKGQTAANTYSSSDTFQVIGTMDGSQPASPPPPVSPPPVSPPPVSPPPASPPPVTTGSGTIVGQGQGDVLIGTSANETFIASAQGQETMTGGGGNDSFVFKSVPWVFDHITDFQPGQDTLDFSALFASSGYTGTDPIADGYVRLDPYGSNGTVVVFDSDGHGTKDLWGTPVVELDNVTPSQLNSHNLFGLQAAASPPPVSPPPVSPPPVTTGTGASVETTQQIQAAVQSILRLDSSASSTASVVAQLSATQPTADQLAHALVQQAIGTTSVATLTYEFFTGSAPTAAGMDYLVDPSGSNPNNLNSAYYSAFNLENRYINFAENLGKAGPDAANFAATYGALSLSDATKTAYAQIFGTTPTDTKVAAILDAMVPGPGGSETRADYFAQIGADGANGIGTKAAMVGWLLAEAAKADVGTFAQSNDAFLTDVALHNAPFGVDVVGHYAQPGFAYTGG